MTPFFKKFIEKLNRLDWNSHAQTFAEVEVLLAGLNEERELLREELASQRLDERIDNAWYSRELSTHFKWYLFKEPRLGYEVWLHEYKSRSMLKPGYAIVPHNHVYWFSSLVLNGGFKHYKYAVKNLSADETFTELEKVGEVNLDRGAVFTVNPHTIHSLADIKDSTVTFIINCRAVKPYSEEYSLEQRKIIRHSPLLTRIKDSHPVLDRI